MTVFLTAFSMYLVVSFAFNMYFVFRTLFKIYTVFITGINTNLPANKTPVMEVDSEIVLNLFLALATESVKSMVVVVIFLNIVDNLLTLSDDDTDWVIVLNDALGLHVMLLNVMLPNLIFVLLLLLDCFGILQDYRMVVESYVQTFGLSLCLQSNLHLFL